MAAVRRFMRAVLRFCEIVVGVSALLACAGALYAVSTGSGGRTSVASALFIGGGVLFVGSGIAGGGARGRRSALRRGGLAPVAPQMPFAWLIVGVAVIGVGVLAVVL